MRVLLLLILFFLPMIFSCGEKIPTYASGAKYVGESKDGKRHGQGMFTWALGDKYVGEWKDDKRYGEGTYTTVSGSKYTGEWKNDNKHGEGTMTYANGAKYTGEWNNNKRHGKGTLTYSEGIISKGLWKKGEFIGTSFMPNMYRSPSLETYGEGNCTIPNGTITIGLQSFDYDKSNEGYLKAGEEAVNPIENNADNLKKGAKLHAMMCSHCHAINGVGKGTVKHPAYSAVTSYKDTIQIRRSGTSMSELKEGHIFHAITYGLNAMGPHASQLTERERWLIVNYIKQELQ